jgi:hypothetical protein
MTLQPEIDCAFPAWQGYNLGQDDLLFLVGRKLVAPGMTYQENATVRVRVPTNHLPEIH